MAASISLTAFLMSERKGMAVESFAQSNHAKTSDKEVQYQCVFPLQQPPLGHRHTTAAARSRFKGSIHSHRLPNHCLEVSRPRNQKHSSRLYAGPPPVFLGIFLALHKFLPLATGITIYGVQVEENVLW